MSRKKKVREKKKQKLISSAPRQMFSGFRQMLFPKEYRIGRPIWPASATVFLERMVQQPEPSQPSPSEATVEVSPSLLAPTELVRLLCEVGTGLWRLRQKMFQPGTDRPLEEMRRAYRHLEFVWDALTQAGIEIQDHTDRPFDSGISLKVLAFQPTAGIGRERIIETIKPTIYFRNTRIQMGEVIVGTPERPDKKVGPVGGAAEQ